MNPRYAVILEDLAANAAPPATVRIKLAAKTLHRNYSLLLLQIREAPPAAPCRPPRRRCQRQKEARE
jgi:hypothetical protein